MSKGQIVTEGRDIFLLSEIRCLADLLCRNFGTALWVFFAKANEINVFEFFEAWLGAGTEPA